MEEDAIIQLATLADGPEGESYRYQTGIRVEKRKRAASPLPFDYLRFRSLRGLDLNQRPLGYESCVSRSAQAYALATGHVRSPQII
jgi:hypothetical protein